MSSSKSYFSFFLLFAAATAAYLAVQWVWFTDELDTLSRGIPASQKLAALSASLDQGLVGYWKFDEVSGTTAGDSAGTNTGTLTNGPTWVAGKVNNGLNFDGVNDFIDFGSPATLDNIPATGMTVSFWIYLNSIPNGSAMLAKTNNFGVGGWRLIFTDSTYHPRKIRFLASFDGAADIDVFSTTQAPLNQWTNMVLTWDSSGTATNVHMYFDGVEVSYDTRNNGLGNRVSDAAQYFNIAAQGNSPTSLPGIMDEVRVYNRVLTQAEVLAIYSSGDVAPPAILSVASSNVSAAAATITWTTDELSDTQVKYGLTSSLGSQTTLNSTLATSHSASLTGLTQNTTYYYSVRSADPSGNIATSTIASFNTLAPDSIPPVITSISVVGISVSAATVNWTTDETSDSQVGYGLSSVLGTLSPLNPTLVTSHSIAISGLAGNTTYYYKVYSRDANGNLGQSTIVKFATLAPPPQLTAGGIVNLPLEVMGPNVSPNSGFENLTSGQPTGWLWVNAPFTADTVVKRSGAVSLRLDAPAGATHTASYKVFLKKGTYTLSGYIKTQGLTSAEPWLDSVRIEVTTGGWPPCCGAGYGQPVYVNAGDVDWTYREETRIIITTDTDVYITVRALGSITGGKAWFDDIEFREILPKPIDVFMLYPNYRGYLFDDYSQTTRFDVTVTPPTGTALSEYRVEAKIFDEIASTTIRTDTFTPSANFTANVDGTGFVKDRTYLATFRLVRLSNSEVVYEYPAYRISKIAGSKRSAMTVSFDEKNRMLLRGQPFFPLSVFDAGTPITASPAAWESTLTTYRRLFEVPLNNYLNYQNGGAGNAYMLPLLDLFQSKGITDFGIANCFERSTVDGGNTVYPFWLLNASEADIKTRAEHPAFIGFYVNDECHHSMVPNTFLHYQDIKRLDPDGITLGSSNTPGYMYLWRDSMDLFALDPYPLYGAEPSGGYPLHMVADWITTLRKDLKSSRPFWIDLQFFQTTGASRWPSANEMRSMAYMGIVEGANGVTWWSLGVRALAYVCNPSTDWCAARVDYYNRLKLIMNELKSLELVFLSDDRPDLLTANSNSSGIKTRVKFKDNKGYILSYNYTNVTTTATLTWSQTPTSVSVYNEARNIVPLGSSFTDSFKPYEAHVYMVATSGVLPISPAPAPQTTAASPPSPVPTAPPPPSSPSSPSPAPTPTPQATTPAPPSASTPASASAASAPGSPPQQPTSIVQLDENSFSLSEGVNTKSTVIRFSGRITDPDTNSVKLRIELRRTKESFTGSSDGIIESIFQPSGSIITIGRGGLTPGTYKWRYQSMDSYGKASAWSEFGTSGKADFTIGPSAPATAPLPPAFTRSLSRGSRHPEVKSLQLLLIEQGYLASGNATGYFGPLTESALRQFQCKHKIVCTGDVWSTGWGNVGPKTRARFNLVL